MNAVPHPADPGFHARNVCVRRGGRMVLHDLSLTIAAAESVAIIGPNGAGKTTMLLTLLGLLPIHTGALRYGAMPLRALTPRQRAAVAAYVPQALDHHPELTVHDVVAGGRFAHLSPLVPLRPADEDAVAAALVACGIASLAARPLRAVSAGERQKTLLAAAFAQDAQTLFLDEPLTALDPAVQADLVALLQSWKARGRGVIGVSHDLHFPAALADRVIALKDGLVVADGAPRDVLTPEVLTPLFGHPFDEFQSVDGRTLVLPRY